MRPRRSHTGPGGRAGAPARRPSGRSSQPSRAARLCVTATTTGLVLLAAALPAVGDRIATAASDPVTGTLVALAGLGDAGRSEPVAEAAPAASLPGPPAVVVRREPVREPAPVSREGTGELAVVPGTDAPPGGGPVRRYLVEVEEGLGVDAEQFARSVHVTLNDRRSWAANGAMAFERVDASAASRVAFRVALTSPDTTDRLCAPLRTGGELSCHNGGRAVLNVVRWLDGVQEHPDLAVYRQYLVNHEVGHALGRGHVDCPGAGELAPVMQQQSKGVAPCLPNAWPHPDRATTG
jgi:hypothetical protein